MTLSCAKEHPLHLDIAWRLAYKPGLNHKAAAWHVYAWKAGAGATIFGHDCPPGWLARWRHPGCVDADGAGPLSSPVGTVPQLHRQCLGQGRRSERRYCGTPGLDGAPPATPRASTTAARGRPGPRWAGSIWQPYDWKFERRQTFAWKTGVTAVVTAPAGAALRPG